METCVAVVLLIPLKKVMGAWGGSLPLNLVIGLWFAYTGMLHSFLGEKDFTTVIHDLITYWLEYCNGSTWGYPLKQYGN